MQAVQAPSQEVQNQHYINLKTVLTDENQEDETKCRGSSYENTFQNLEIETQDWTSSPPHVPVYAEVTKHGKKMKILSLTRKKILPSTDEPTEYAVVERIKDEDRHHYQNITA